MYVYHMLERIYTHQKRALDYLELELQTHLRTHEGIGVLGIKPRAPLMPGTYHPLPLSYTFSLQTSY